MQHSLERLLIPTRVRVPITTTILSAAIVALAGCAAQVRVAGPAVYVPPPAVVAADDEGVVEVRVAPPPLPVYEQPPCPVVGWIWTPGYWAWSPGGYYWVPGTWVQPPRVGVLWTPGYWGWASGVYVWHVGYWGPHIGFYGGVNYGFGYTGVGFGGGYWRGGVFFYNRAVANVTRIHVTNVYYDRTVINNVSVTRVSYNGGAGGITARPTAVERIAERESHIQPTPMQRQHVQEARRNPALFAKANGGHPAIAATPRPGAFDAPGVIHARGANPALVRAAARHDNRRGRSGAGHQGGPHAAHANGAHKPQKRQAKQKKRPEPQRRDDER